MRQLRLVRESFHRLETQATIASLILYRHLFSIDPSLRPLFQSSIELQGRKLMEALSCTVATLDQPEAALPMLEALGRRHVTYGTHEGHYLTLTNALLRTLAETLGTSFTPETRQAWRLALEFVCEAMKRGAAPLQALKAGASQGLGTGVPPVG